jgi:membrane-associated phospholipid phosphatase
MNLHKVVVWWPLIALLAMVVLGVAVGHGTTPIDTWFTRAGEDHRLLRRLRYFTNVRVMLPILVVCVVAALYRRRWRLAVVIFLTPPIAIIVERLAKRGFQRRFDGSLAYPSGHTTLLVVLLGFAVITAGAAAWAVAVAVAYGLLGMLGLSFTIHYFTDTIGGLLLGTALLCLAARVAGLDRCQPECDVRHSSG